MKSLFFGSFEKGASAHEECLHLRDADKGGRILLRGTGDIISNHLTASKSEATSIFLPRLQFSRGKDNGAPWFRLKYLSIVSGEPVDCEQNAPYNYDHSKKKDET